MILIEKNSYLHNQVKCLILTSSELFAKFKLIFFEFFFFACGTSENSALFGGTGVVVVVDTDKVLLSFSDLKEELKMYHKDIVGVP